MSSLRARTIRLAHSEPGLRPILLPLLKTAALQRKYLTREQVSGMSAAAINKALDRVDVESSKINDEFINTGRGTERPSEIHHMTDPLAQKFNQLEEERFLLRAEVERRYGPRSPSRLPRGFGPIR